MKITKVGVLYSIGEKVKILDNIDGVVIGWYITGKKDVTYKVSFLDGCIAKSDLFYQYELSGKGKQQVIGFKELWNTKDPRT